MKHLKLALIVPGFLLLGCDPTDSKNPLPTNEIPVDTIDDQILQQETSDDSVPPEDYSIDGINNAIALFREKNIDKISGIIRFPLYRQYPIPPIKDKKEFKQRFSEVFDQVLIDRIANSEIDQWSEVGWRGIMLDNGDVWMSDSDGIITAVNYQSEVEKKMREDLIEKEKENLHISLRTFESPTYKIETKTYLVRIDELVDYKYRYASWKMGEKESSKPDIIIENGEIEYQGSGGNHQFTFVNGIYTYKIYRNIIGAQDTPDITLEVEKDGELILTEDGKLIID